MLPIEQITQPVITRISVARLYSTGDYGHVRYELTAEVPPGKAAQTLTALDNILVDLAPNPAPYCYDHYKELVAKSATTALDEDEAHFLEKTKVDMESFEARADKQKRAVERLDALCGVTVVKDANAPSF